MEASAPGKVLIVGGYLIVQGCTPPNQGLSIGVDARFTTRVDASAPSATPGSTTIHVQSPQFHQQYTFVCTTDGSVVKVDQTAGNKSPFIYYAVLYSVAAARAAGDNADHELTISLHADNDFYSQRNYLEEKGIPVNVANLRALPKHLPLVGDVSKTGLGSSAAMTCSVVACLCSFFRGEACDKEQLHRIAQIAHSVTQGKIGSGFDVFTGIYGTCAYSRFSPDRVTMMMESGEAPSHVDAAVLAKCIDPAEEWVKVVPFRLPAGIKLVLGDVHQGGSSTPGMVAKIMAWQKANASNPDSWWEKLRHSNGDYIEHLRQLIAAAEKHPDAYAAAMKKLATVPSLSTYKTAEVTEGQIVSAAKLATNCRTYLREMGMAAEVKVEPEELTGLLNDTAALPGVFAVGCPGAGGYDAVFALVLGDECASAVEHFWEHYPSMHVCPLLVREDAQGLVVKKQAE